MSPRELTAHRRQNIRGGNMDAMSITRSIYMGVEKYLSDEELLFKQFGFNTIKHIVESADKVACNISTNAYGEFAFVDVMFGDQTYTLWGLGYHHVSIHQWSDFNLLCELGYLKKVFPSINGLILTYMI